MLQGLAHYNILNTYPMGEPPFSHPIKRERFYVLAFWFNAHFTISKCPIKTSSQLAIDYFQGVKENPHLVTPEQFIGYAAFQAQERVLLPFHWRNFYSKTKLTLLF